MIESIYYLIFSKNSEIEINDTITYNISGYNVSIHWIKNEEFNYYYHQEELFGNDAIRQHTIRLIQDLEETYNKKIKYRLSKRVVLEKIIPAACGFIN